MTDAPTPGRAGASRLGRSVLGRLVALAAVASVSVILGAPAYAQTSADPAQTTTQTPTDTTPTQTTPTQTTPTQTTPTETTPTTTSPDPTSAPNEYVESVPTGGGQQPASPAASAPAAPAPAAPATPADTASQSAVGASGDEKPAARKHHRKNHRHSPVHHSRADAPVPAETAPVLATPAAADTGEPADPIVLGLALLLITGVVLGSAVARRQRAVT